jgi:putative DNA primase/helicase
MNQNKIDLERLDWHTVLPRLGVASELIANPRKLGPCPIEGGGKTRFRFDNKGGRGSWICNHCGAGDGVRLVALVNNVDDSEALRLIREVITGVRREGLSVERKAPVPSATRTAEEISKASRLIDRTLAESRPIEGTAAMKYLQNRIQGLRPEWLKTDNLRFHPRMYHFDEETASRSFSPAMLGLVRNANSPETVVTLHRYYITENGYKAKVSPTQVKKMMSARVEKIHGESILLNTAPQGKVIIVSEGLESGLGWVMATANRVPVYAAMNCGNLGNFVWPEGIEGLLIAADHDSADPKTGMRPGTHHAMLLKKRAVQAGLKALIKVPMAAGIDWDDLWNTGNFPSVDFLFKPEPEAQAA